MKISIVINSYNHARFVAQAIESALAQTHDDCEVIVVDDGSTDDSAAVIGRYVPRVLFQRQANGGQRAAYNTGFALAHGAVVVFLDSDDWLYPEAAARIAAAWRPGLAKLHWLADLVDSAGQPLGRQVPRSLHDREAPGLAATFGVYGSAAGSANAYAADYLAKILPLPLERDRPGDAEPVVYAPLYGEVGAIREPLSAYRIHKPDGDGSLLFNNLPKSLWFECARMLADKRRVEQRLTVLGLPHWQPLALAPWEGRVLVLAHRFGGAPPASITASERRLLPAFTGLWRWPSMSVAHKLATSVWMLGVLALPAGLARRLAFMHRRHTGVAANAATRPGNAMAKTVGGERA